MTDCRFACLVVCLLISSVTATEDIKQWESNYFKIMVRNAPNKINMTPDEILASMIELRDSIPKSFGIALRQRSRLEFGIELGEVSPDKCNTKSLQSYSDPFFLVWQNTELLEPYVDHFADKQVEICLNELNRMIRSIHISKAARDDITSVIENINFETIRILDPRIPDELLTDSLLLFMKAKKAIPARKIGCFLVRNKKKVWERFQNSFNETFKFCEEITEKTKDIVEVFSALTLFGVKVEPSMKKYVRWAQVCRNVIPTQFKDSYELDYNTFLAYYDKQTLGCFS